MSLKINNPTLQKSQNNSEIQVNQVGGYLGFYLPSEKNSQTGQVRGQVRLVKSKSGKLGIQTPSATHKIPESLAINIIKENSNEYISNNDRKKIIQWISNEIKNGSIKKFYPIDNKNFQKKASPTNSKKPATIPPSIPKNNNPAVNFLITNGNKLSKIVSFKTRQFYSTAIDSAKNTAIDFGSQVRNRQPVDLIEGATFSKDASGTTYTLNNGVKVPPISRTAFNTAIANLPPELRKAADGYLFEVLKQNPYVPIIAAEIQSGKLASPYVTGNRFDSDRYLSDQLMPMLAKGFTHSGSSPYAWIDGFIFSVATMRDPIVRNLNPNATSGTASSFKKNELAISKKQVLTQRLLSSQKEILGNVYLEGMKSYESSGDRGRLNPQTNRYPRKNGVGVGFFNALGRIPQVTIGTEETPTMFAKAIHDMPDKSHFSPQMQSYSTQVVSHLGKVQSQERQLLSDLDSFSKKYTNPLSQIFFLDTLTSLDNLGFGKTLDQNTMTLVPGTMLSVYAAHHELQGYTLADSYRRARDDVARFYQNNEAQLSDAELSYRFLKDNLWNEKTWNLLGQKYPEMSSDIKNITDRIKILNTLYGSGVDLNLKIYDQMIIDNLDISTQSATHLGPAAVAHAEKLVDNAFQPNPSQKTDPNYQKFRRSLVMYLREVAPSHHIQGDPKKINRDGFEMTSIPDLMAPEGTTGPMLHSLKSLYTAMKNQGDIKGWQFETMQKVILYGAMASAGVDPSSMAAELRAVRPLVRKYQDEVKQIVGARGYENNGVLFGLLVNDKLIRGFANWRVPRIDSTKQSHNMTLLSQSNGGQVPQVDLKDLFFSKSAIPALTNGLIAEGNPEFRVVDGQVNMQITLNGKAQVFKAINRTIPEFFAPALMDTVSLQGDPQAVADQLNRVVRLTHAMMGGTIVATT